MTDYISKNIWCLDRQQLLYVANRLNVKKYLYLELPDKTLRQDKILDKADLIEQIINKYKGKKSKKIYYRSNQWSFDSLPDCPDDNAVVLYKQFNPSTNYLYIPLLEKIWRTKTNIRYNDLYTIPIITHRCENKSEVFKTVINLLFPSNKENYKH